MEKLRSNLGYTKGKTAALWESRFKTTVLKVTRPLRSEAQGENACDGFTLNIKKRLFAQPLFPY